LERRELDEGDGQTMFNKERRMTQTMFNKERRMIQTLFKKREE